MTLENNEFAMAEVIDFSKACKFLFASVCPESLPVKVVNEVPADFTNAGPEGKSYSDISEDELTFSDIKSDELSTALDELNRDKRKNSLAGHARRVLMGKSDVLHKITGILPKKYLKEACDEIILEDLLYCAQWRVAFGIKDGFWETIFQIYKSGGMPIGWSGKYPEGKLMAIFPGLK